MNAETSKAESPTVWLKSARTKLGYAENWLLGAKRATYGVAMVRIIFGVTALGFLAANWVDRHYLWGDAARWLDPLHDRGGFGWPFTFFSGEKSQLELDLKLTIMASLLILLVLGWRTRVLAPIILVLWVSLLEWQPIYGDQSDNIFRIVLLYMCFADMSGRWSLDARRRLNGSVDTRRAPIRPKISPDARERMAKVAVLLHNVAVLATGVQVCIIYLASGLYKVQGELWQNGTGIYYPLQVGQYRPWPLLADLLTANSLAVMAATYFSVLIQVFFPLMLLRRATRVIALLGVSAMHLGIATVMGLPFFSMFIMAGDMLFIRDTTYQSIQRWLTGWRSDRRAFRHVPQGMPVQENETERLPAGSAAARASLAHSSSRTVEHRPNHFGHA